MKARECGLAEGGRLGTPPLGTQPLAPPPADGLTSLGASPALTPLPHTSAACPGFPARQATGLCLLEMVRL